MDSEVWVGLRFRVLVWALGVGVRDVTSRLKFISSSKLLQSSEIAFVPQSSLTSNVLPVRVFAALESGQSVCC